MFGFRISHEVCYTLYDNFGLLDVTFWKKSLITLKIPDMEEALVTEVPILLVTSTTKYIITKTLLETEGSYFFK